MPIQGMTSQVERSYPLIGMLMKGGEKGDKPIGEDLEYFRFKPVGEDDHAMQASFEANYGIEPHSLEVKLCYDTPELVFDTWMKAKAHGGRLQVKCDGQRVVRWFDEKSQRYKAEGMECGMSPTGKCSQGCKPSGELSLILPKLDRMGRVAMMTTSIYDVNSIWRSVNQVHHDIQMIMSKSRSEEEISLSGVTWVLSRSVRKVPTTFMSGKGANAKPKRQLAAKSLVTLSVSEDWAQIILQAKEMISQQAMMFQLSSVANRQIMPGAQAAGAIAASTVEAAVIESEVSEPTVEFLPVTKNGANAALLLAGASELGIGGEQLKPIIESLYPGAHSSQFRQQHLDAIVEEMCMKYAAEVVLSLDRSDTKLMYQSMGLGSDPDIVKRCASWAAQIESMIPVDDDIDVWDEDPSLDIDEVFSAEIAEVSEASAGEGQKEKASA